MIRIKLIFHQMTSQCIRPEFSTRSAIDLSEGPMALLFEVQAAASEGPMWRRTSKPLGTKLKPHFF